MKQITITTLGILMIASAMAMYGGESITFETNLTNPVYTVIGNSSNIDGLNITFENGSIKISPALNYKPDNFTLVFFDNKTREVEKIVYRGGGGSSTKYIDRNITVYVPEYINNTDIVEVEKIVEKIEYQETGLKPWHIILGIVLTSIIMWMIMRKESDE